MLLIFTNNYKFICYSYLIYYVNYENVIFFLGIASWTVVILMFWNIRKFIHYLWLISVNLNKRTYLCIFFCFHKNYVLFCDWIGIGMRRNACAVEIVADLFVIHDVEYYNEKNVIFFFLFIRILFVITIDTCEIGMKQRRSCSWCFKIVDPYRIDDACKWRTIRLFKRLIITYSFIQYT